MELTTINSETLHTLLKGGMVASGKDKYLPVLNSVRVEIREPLVRVVSTDRYRLLIGDVDMPEGTAMETGNFLITVDQVKDLVKVLPVKKNSGDVLIELSDDEKYVSFTYDGSDGKWSREYQVLIGEFPRYESLIPTVFEGTNEVRFNSVFMADIAKLPVKDKNTYVHMRLQNATKPMLGEIEGANGVAWTYMLMPVRIPV
jgi:DNA polymerase III sliding clamp (beta) subunit (PCNA family)